MQNVVNDVIDTNGQRDEVKGKALRSIRGEFPEISLLPSHELLQRVPVVS